VGISGIQLCWAHILLKANAIKAKVPKSSDISLKFLVGVENGQLGMEVANGHGGGTYEGVFAWLARDTHEILVTRHSSRVQLVTPRGAAAYSGMCSWLLRIVQLVTFCLE
jgi:hypothetical protein